MLNNKGRTVFEMILTLTLIGILLIGAVTYLERTTTIIKEYSLISELSNMRTTILLYFVINKKFPDSLKQMVNEKILLPFHDTETLKKMAAESSGLNLQSGTIIIDRTYLEKIAMDKDGNITDPFGHPYDYDARVGRISSSTPHYEGW